MKYLLAHDLGTSGNKATLFSEEGKLIKSYIGSYECRFFNGNWAEQSPADYWECVCKTTKLILGEVSPSDIVAVSFSGQMMGCICVDKTGNPLRPSIIWADQRSSNQSEKISRSISAKDFFNITGHRNSASYGIQKLMWVKDNEPEVYSKMYKMLNCKDYIVYKLTGVFAGEYTDAASTAALDIKNLKWSEDILRAAEVDFDIMPELHESTYIAGGVTKEASEACGLLAGTPVVMGGGDGCCAAAGAGSISPGNAYCCLGSSSWVSYTAKEPLFDDEMLIFNWPSMEKGLVNPCGTMQAAGVSYGWMRDNICKYENEIAKNSDKSVYELINEQIDEAEAGSNGLLFLPYIMGERSPRWNPNARGAFIGLKTEHTRKELLRSVMEGITLNLMVILSVFRKSQDITEMLLIGGGAKSHVWMQIMADCFGVNILRPNYIEEATSMGAAIAAGVGVGMFKNFSAIDKFLKVEEIIKPNMDVHKKYNEILPLFNEAYHALIGFFDKLAKIS